MIPLKTILMATDLSERSREVFRVASSLATEGVTRLVVLHVTEQEPSLAFGDLGVVVPSSFEGRPDLDALRDRLREEFVPVRPIQTEYLVRDGDAADEVLRAAEEFRADLIALGTHGRTGLRRLLAGSVAESVLRKAVCPVLALRTFEAAGPAEAIRGILHPTDDSEESRGALMVARELARYLGVRLVLLHVTLPADTVPGVIPFPIDLKEEHETLDALRRRMEGPDLKERVEVMLGRGDVAEETLRAAAESHCDLIVLGTHGRTGLRRLLMGSVAEAVLRRADRPVLVVKGPVPQPEMISSGPAEAAAAR